MANRFTRYERIMYPIDWIEERSGLVGGIRYFLFRNVPSDTNWFQTLGAATLTAFLVQATTGVLVEDIGMGLQMGDQGLTVVLALIGLTQAVEVEFDPAQTQ